MDHQFQLQKMACSGQDAIKKCRRPVEKKNAANAVKSSQQETELERDDACLLEGYKFKLQSAVWKKKTKGRKGRKLVLTEI